MKALLPPMIQAAQASGKILLKHFGQKLRVSEKPGAGLVTNADLESERTCMKILSRARADFGFLTEEANPAGTSAARGRWVIDPLDGTTNYVHGFPMFCVSLAAEWDGKVVAAVIYHPTLKDTYTAALGKGAELNGKKMQVSKTANLHDSLLTTGFTYRKDEWLKREMDAFERLSATARAVRRPGSAALDLAYVARGVFDGFWERRLSPWDVAAGSLLVTEAGGHVSSFDGSAFSIMKPEILATNGLLHEPLKAAIR